MSVKKDESGRRSVELSFDLPGTPEEVWRAIATGPGISSWFVPSEVEEHVGGAVAFHLGKDMTSTGRVTVWEPPKCFGIEEPGWSGDAPPLASEFHVEALSGGMCRVRLIHSLFGSSDDWDDQLESMEKGWAGFFNILRIYLTHFPELPAASARPSGSSRGTLQEAWDTLTKKLNLSQASLGEHKEASIDGDLSFSGIVERIDQSRNHYEITLRLDRPAPGVALVGAFVWDGQAQVAISLYFYGEDADAVAQREEPLWQAWINKHFPSPAAAAEG